MVILVPACPFAFEVLPSVGIIVEDELPPDWLNETTTPSLNIFSLQTMLPFGPGVRTSPLKFLLRISTALPELQHHDSIFISEHREAIGLKDSPFCPPLFEQYSMPINERIASGSIPMPSSLTIISFAPTKMTQDREHPCTAFRMSSSTALDTEPMT